MSLEQIGSYDRARWSNAAEHARDKCMDSLKSVTQGKPACFRLAPE